ncbi:MAG: hypothetical protein V4438_02700 [Patescibacteria group bacterium]
MKRNIGIILVITFFSLFVLYGIFEVAKVFLGPSLTITAPKNLDTVSYPIVPVSGHVSRAAYLTIDDRQIFADAGGNFMDRLLLLPGYNIIKVSVKDRFGKEVSQKISIYYSPAN